jgi:hypothetical protein
VVDAADGALPVFDSIPAIAFAGVDDGSVGGQTDDEPRVTLAPRFYLDEDVSRLWLPNFHAELLRAHPHDLNAEMVFSVDRKNVE